jgi:glycosyltransferase involved in cell wall biosynthesis
MAMQKPIVASGIGQLRHIIQHNINGVLVSPRDPSALAEETIRLYHSPDLMQRISMQARLDAVQNYTWTMNAQRMIDFAVRL